MDPFTFKAGKSPLLVSMPHSGTYLPPDLAARFSDEAQILPDTDWHIPDLYDFLGDLDASVIQATHSRYVIDPNRDPEGRSLYPGASSTELCPTSTFADAPIYAAGDVPAEAEIAGRRAAIWQPYHAKIAEALAALRAEHGIALLWDAHSIKSVVPRFFEGTLPDFNLGTGDGISCDPGLIGLITAVAREAEQDLGFSHVLNGRFKGGYITRHHGDPSNGIHAIQLELSEATYMDEDPPFAFRPDLAAKVRPVIAGFLQAMLAWAELEVG